MSNAAVCTSGDYERGDHLVDPRTGMPSSLAASVTVVAPTAMLADALATAAFVLGPAGGLALLERHALTRTPRNGRPAAVVITRACGDSCSRPRKDC